MLMSGVLALIDNERTKLTGVSLSNAAPGTGKAGRKTRSPNTTLVSHYACACVIRGTDCPSNDPWKKLLTDRVCVVVVVVPPPRAPYVHPCCVFTGRFPVVSAHSLSPDNIYPVHTSHTSLSSPVSHSRSVVPDSS